MTSSNLLDLPEIHCSGKPRELGRAQGEAQRERITAYVEQRLEAVSRYLAERGQAELYPGFIRTGRLCAEFALSFDPDGAYEQAGIAEGANVDSGVLYAVTNMTDVRDVLLADPPKPRGYATTPAPVPGLRQLEARRKQSEFEERERKERERKERDREGCTSVLVPKALTREQRTLAGQTWDLNPTDLDYVIAVHRKPINGPETWAVTTVGSLTLMGMNAEGVAVGTTNIKTSAARTGVAYTSMLHRLLRCRSRAEAREVVAAAVHRAAAHTYWVADADGALEFETDALSIIERVLDGAPIVQTNHCQDETLRGRELETPTESSHRRLERATRVLGAGGQDVSTLRALFADRSDGVLSINRYGEDEQGTSTNACLIAVPETRELWACRGSSDRGLWKELKFG